jgi:hypothetical protein
VSRIIHARIDGETEKVLRQLERRLGWNDSQVVREGIKALRALLGRRKAGAIVGLGQFRSGIADLGSNKAHLDGFGQ